MILYSKRINHSFDFVTFKLTFKDQRKHQQNSIRPKPALTGTTREAKVNISRVATNVAGKNLTFLYQILNKYRFENT